MSLQTMAEVHEAVFSWPYTNANTVILTGTFDQWARSIHLQRTSSCFEATVKVPWQEKIAYKFIVDGNWLVRDDQPTERDPIGNLNNVYQSPVKPVTLTSTVTESAALAVIKDASPKSSSAVHGAVTQASKVAEQVVASTVPPISDAASNVSNRLPVKDISQIGVPKGVEGGSMIPQIVTDLAGTIAARDGAPTTLAYVTSGIGAAIQSVIGVDPINGEKIRYESPQVSEFPTSIPVIQQPPSHSVDIPETQPISLAPTVPIGIVPVNVAAPEISSEPPLPASTLEAQGAAIKTSSEAIPDSTSHPVAAGSETPVISPVSAETKPVEPSKEISTHGPVVDLKVYSPTAAGAKAGFSKVEEPSPAIDEPTAELAASPVAVAQTGSSAAVSAEPVQPVDESLSPAQADVKTLTTEASPAVLSTAPPAEEAPASPPVADTETPAGVHASSAPADATVANPSTSETPTNGGASREVTDPNAAVPSIPTPASPAADGAKTPTNGHAVPQSPDAKLAIPSTPTPASSAPTTPAKKGGRTVSHFRFPSSSSIGTNSSSTSPSKFGTDKSRKKRDSFFGKIKEIFHHEKHEKEEKKAKEKK